ncbi:MAG: DNA translocase FtsK [Nitrospirota bacterium]
MAYSSLIEKRLEDFGVEGRITQVHPGPVVTMYEFEPAPGVKINRTDTPRSNLETVSTVVSIISANWA